MGLSRLTSGLLLTSVLLAGCEPGEVEEHEAHDARKAGVAYLPLRPDARDGGLPPPTYEADQAVEVLDSAAGNLRVHFARGGAHAVPSADGDRDGIPDYVALVAEEYERVLAFFRTTLGFMPPLSDIDVRDGNGGDGRFDVYLLNFPTGADGAFRSEQCSVSPLLGCTGYMLQENDFDGRSYANLSQATRILASHELFHAVQSAYVAQPSGVLAEATAVWASEAYEPALDDFEHSIAGYLSRPERSLLQEPTGPPDAFSYGAALLFRQLELTHDRALVRLLWEELARATEPDERWSHALDRVLTTHYQSSLADAFADFARWNLYTGARADGATAYPEGARYPAVAEGAVALPFHDALVRMLPLSARYFVAPASSPQVHVALSGARSDLSSLRWIVAVERAGRIVQVREGPGTLPLASDVLQGGGDRVHAVLIDTRLAGATVRVAVCLGDEEALAPCASVATASGAGTERPLDATTSDAASAEPSLADAGGAGTSRPDATEVRESGASATAAASTTDASAERDTAKGGAGCALSAQTRTRGPVFAIALSWGMLLASFLRRRPRRGRRSPHEANRTSLDATES